MIDLSSLKPQLNGKPVAILGLGKSGLHAHAALKAAGIETVLWDDNKAAVEATAQQGAATEDLSAADFSRFSLLCMAPGIPLTHPAPHPAVLRAQAAGVEIVCDIELLHRAHPAIKTIGITGTNGKSTTTALIGHILKASGVESAVGGNIGEASLSLPQLSAQGIYVLELSSYQLDLCPRFSPDIALLINISPDHLDRHGGMAGYVAAKKKIFRGKGTAIVGLDDAPSAGVFSELAGGGRQRIGVSCLQVLQDGVSVTEEGILQDKGRDVFDIKTCPALNGQHNWQNAALAYAACLAAGVAADKIFAGMRSFPGLAHRQNIVAEKNGVRYINDSKATNDQAAAMALRTYDPIYWIAGGKPKDGGYPDCEKYISHVRHAFLIGVAQDKMAAWLDSLGVAYTKSETMERALQAAHAQAQSEQKPGAVVLLSPACASFDQFKSFEHRGDVFVDLVKKVVA